MTANVAQFQVPITPSTVNLGNVPAGATMTVQLTATSTLFNSTQSYGSSTTATAGSTLVSMPLAAGSWALQVTTHVWGTGASSVENNNMRFNMGGTGLTLTVDGGAGTTPFDQQFTYVAATATTVTVTAIANASSNTVYTATITATPVSSDVYLGFGSAVTTTTGMPIGTPGSVTFDNPPGAAPFSVWATAGLRTHTVAVTTITPR